MQLSSLRTAGSLPYFCACFTHDRCAPPAACLPVLQPELSRVLFPAFAHTYLNLVALGAQTEAQQLMGEHRQRFVDAAVGGSSLRIQVRAAAAAGASIVADSGRRGGRPTHALWLLVQPHSHAKPHHPLSLLLDTRSQELQDLAGITSAEALGASRTATALRQRRVSIRLCRASYDLLTQHLQVGVGDAWR